MDEDGHGCFFPRQTVDESARALRSFVGSHRLFRSVFAVHRNHFFCAVLGHAADDGPIFFSDVFVDLDKAAVEAVAAAFFAAGAGSATAMIRVERGSLQIVPPLPSPFRAGLPARDWPCRLRRLVRWYLGGTPGVLEWRAMMKIGWIVMVAGLMAGACVSR